MTSTTLATLAPGKFKTLTKVQPTGSLQARRDGTGAVSFYWRYSHRGYSERVSIGIFDPTAPARKLEPGPRGHSMASAVRSAEVLAVEHCNARKEGGRPALIAERAAAAAELVAKEARAATATLEHLLLEYCDWLEGLGRQSHRNARSIFRLHVIAPYPALAGKQAAYVTTEEFTAVMRRLSATGKKRTSNKLRSYARAAYELAIGAATKASVPERFKEFGIQTNPIAATRPDETANRSAKNPLALHELRTYWNLIKEAPGFEGAVLRLHLLSGGQRIEQLVRLKTEKIKEAEGYFILSDGKGRPGAEARDHWIPITPLILKSLKQCMPRGQYALSTAGGKLPLAGTTLSGWAKQRAGPLIANFTAKRVRSGVETALASAEVSKEDRGRLQSHGISGVQARHYDGHEYLNVKRRALETLEELLHGPRRKRTSFRSGRENQPEAAPVPLSRRHRPLD